MDVRGWETVSALLPANRLMVVVGIFMQLVTMFVYADDHHKDDNSTENKADEEDREYCEKECDYGCCENNRCCDPHADLPSYTVQVIAVVGGCVVTLLLLFLCIVRYRMAAKFTNARSIRRNTGNVEAGRSSTTTTSASCASVCSGVSVTPPGPHSRIWPWNSLRTLLLLEENRRSTNLENPGAQVVTPPPYSELYPQGFTVSDEHEQLPPPYDEAVKTCVTAPTSSTSSSSSSSTSAPAEETRD